jgi:IS4 transposase
MVKQKSPVAPPAKVYVSELLDLIPLEYIEEVTRELQVDKWVKKLKCLPLFKLVMFSILQSERLSLRVMEENVSDPLFKLFAPAMAKDEATYSGIRDRLMHVKPEFFSRLYTKVYELAEKTYGSKSLKTHHIKRFDSTMIGTFSHLLTGMKVGNTSKGKTQVKFTTEFKDDFLIHMNYHADQAHLSEETALKEAVNQRATKSKDEISVFDKGLKSRETLGFFDDNETLFVARAHENVRYKFISTHSEAKIEENPAETDLVFVQDSAVNLYGSSNNLSPNKLRLIQYEIKKSGLILSFVTNVWDIDASLIADIYKMRWDIEVLFRFMKQEMNLTHFVCNDKNAIEVMLYCTMICSMLVLIYKKKNQIKSYKIAKNQFFKELLYGIILDMLEIPEATEYLKLILLKYIKKK